MTDRNLLFAMVALQLDFITRDALVEALQAWMLDKSWWPWTENSTGRWR